MFSFKVIYTLKLRNNKRKPCDSLTLNCSFHLKGVYEILKAVANAHFHIRNIQCVLFVKENQYIGDFILYRKNGNKSVLLLNAVYIALRKIETYK